jgi:hypothetical protein
MKKIKSYTVTIPVEETITIRGVQAADDKEAEKIAIERAIKEHERVTWMVADVGVEVIEE